MSAVWWSGSYINMSFKLLFWREGAQAIKSAGYCLALARRARWLLKVRWEVGHGRVHWRSERPGLIRSHENGDGTRAGADRLLDALLSLSSNIICRTESLLVLTVKFNTNSIHTCKNLFPNSAPCAKNCLKRKRCPLSAVNQSSISQSI